MPQMAPINWLSLFFMFSLTLVMFNLLNYFSFNINNNSTAEQVGKNYLSPPSNWKW